MTAAEDSDQFQPVLASAFSGLSQALEKRRGHLELEEVGVVSWVGRGIIGVTGLPGVEAEELVALSTGALGLAFDLSPAEVAVVLLGRSEGVEVGQEVRRTGRVADVPVGEALLGRVLDARGEPLDEAGPLPPLKRRAIEQAAPPIMDRDPVEVPLQTGVRLVDALVPVGRGQRELILGDRQTGKTALAIDAIIAQKEQGLPSIYCAVGQRSAAVAKVVDSLRRYGALERTIVLVAGEDDPLGLRYLAPFAATAMAEFFMERGQDALIVYDDLTRHARAYRELSLLLRRPPAREAFPGDIFYLHSRLLERSTRLSQRRGGGSLTALPIVETEAQNISAYIPTNLISITDGQLYLSPQLFQAGQLPAVDVGLSVSRVGGKTQLPAYRAVSGQLRLAYAQFQELEAFARFGTTLDQETRRRLRRGERVREALKQPQFEPRRPALQVAVLWAATAGLLDEVLLSEVAEAIGRIEAGAAGRLGELSRRLEAGEPLDDAVWRGLEEAVHDAIVGD